MIESIVISLVHAVALPVARATVWVWTQTYTSVAPEDIRHDRREEVRSDSHEQATMLRAAGYGPTVISFVVLFRMARGLLSDVIWAAPYVPSALITRLETGSKTIESLGMPGQAITVVALLGLINFAVVMSQDPTLLEFLSVNSGVLLGARISSKKHRPWYPRVTFVLHRFFLVFGTGVIMWIVFYHRLYQFPLFYPMMLSTMPIALAWGVASEPIRRRLLGNRWRLVVACWSIILATSIAVSYALDAVQAMLVVWGLALMVIGGFALLTLMYFGFLFGTAAVWCGGIAMSTRGMNAIAAGIRRLL